MRIKDLCTAFAFLLTAAARQTPLSANQASSASTAEPVPPVSCASQLSDNQLNYAEQIWGATCWGRYAFSDNVPGCRVFITTPIGFQEYRPDETSVGGWIPSRVHHYNGVIPAARGSIAVLNTMDVIDTKNPTAELDIFFVTEDDAIWFQRYPLEWDRQGPWRNVWPGLIPPVRPEYLTTASWQDSDGGTLPTI